MSFQANCDVPFKVLILQANVCKRLQVIPMDIPAGPESCYYGKTLRLFSSNFISYSDATMLQARNIAGLFRSPSMWSPFSPAMPTLTSEMQFGCGPKFLLLSSAPASGGFIAEAVGTCQGSPLRFDR